jgi:tRNA modification GTPase
LVNALANRDVAIVSDVPGTTRDVIEVRLDLKGYPVILADTAGLREARGPIEEEGIRRAEARAVSADLRLLVLDGTLPAPKKLPSAELKVWSKCDLVSTKAREGLRVSSKTGEGLNELIDALAGYAERGMARGEAPVVTRARHRQALEEAAKSLEQAASEEAPELAAEHLRRALRYVGRITGRVDLDELLDVVFRDFCLGK